MLTDEAAYQTALGSETASRGWFRCHWNAAGRCTEFTLYTFRQRAGPQPPVPFERFYWPILTHEGVHQILQEYAGRNRIPDLLNEGFAAYFQGWNLGRTPAENMQRRTSEYLAELTRPALTRDEIPRLSEIYDPQPWDVDSFGRRTLVRYAAAESLVEQHLADPAGRMRLRTMLWQALDGAADHDANRRYLDAIQEGFAQALVERAQRP